MQIIWQTIFTLCNQILRIQFSFSKTYYKLYDVYNNGYNFGGKLRIIFDRYIMLTLNNDIFFTESIFYSKIAYRNHLNDITIRIGVIVNYNHNSIKIWYDFV